MAHGARRTSGESRGQTRKNAKKSRQPPTLHFVKVAVSHSRPHFPVRDAQEERKIRTHVMKHYLQQKLKSSKPRSTSAAVSRLSDHVIQFRLVSQGNQKASRRGTKEVISDERNSTPTKTRAIIPKDPQTSRDVVSVEPLAKSVLCNSPSPTHSTPGTSALIEYYHHGFWENSLAVNPEGTMMPMALSDPVIFHATLCRVALHKLQTRGGPTESSFFWHRGEAMRLISQTLADPRQATSDTTIGAVAILSNADNNVSLSHLMDLIDRGAET